MQMKVIHQKYYFQMAVREVAKGSEKEELKMLQPSTGYTTPLTQLMSH